jgi:hypothetical protein
MKRAILRDARRHRLQSLFCSVGFLAIVLLSVVIALLCGCSTESADIPRSSSAGYVDGVRDSGVKGVVQSRSTGVRSLVISASDRIDYNKLIAKYGSAAILNHAPLKADAGLIVLPDGNWSIQNDYFVDYGLMRDMRAMDGYIATQKKNP